MPVCSGTAAAASSISRGGLAIRVDWVDWVDWVDRVDGVERLC